MVGAPGEWLYQPVEPKAGQALPLSSRATVSIDTVSGVDAGETLPNASDAVAMNVRAPSGRDVVMKLQLPSARAVVDPRRVAPSKTRTVAPAAALPRTV